MAVKVMEVMGRASQGRTEPYICRCDDDAIYFVKGRSLPRRELVCEWVAASLAAALGLPVPPFALVDVPDEFNSLFMGDWLRELGTGIAFGSKRELASDFVIDYRQLVPVETRRLVAAFDWWTCNMDRTLTPEGGNSNLLWRATGREAGEVIVIDHNLAFDLHFDPELFLDTHVFASDLKGLASDFLDRGETVQRFQQALSHLDVVLGAVPAEWAYIDPEQTVVAQWHEDEFRSVLRRCHNDGFWNLNQ